jgi:DNA-binding beta-propeller fold protein YncE
MSYRAALLAATLVLLIAAASALAVTGQLTQLPGAAGCVSADGFAGGECTVARAFDSPVSVAVSPDGENAYITASGGDYAVAAFQRDTTTGQLTQLAGTAGCVSEHGTAGCADGKALELPSSVAVSPDGKNVYVASNGNDVTRSAVAVFRRDGTSGQLTQLAGTSGCVSQTGTGGACADGIALRGANSVAVSPDGKNVYVASVLSNAVAAFHRNATTGELTQLAGAAGCVREPAGACRSGRELARPFSLAVSADGKNVYVASPVSGAVAVLKRNPTTGALFQSPGTGGCASLDASCTPGKALEGARSVAVSGDGKHVYVASNDADAVAVFRRNATTGALTQLAGPAGKAGCVSETGSSGECTEGKALDEPRSVAVSADDKSVYVASFQSDAVAVFSRNPTGGLLTQPAGAAGCVSKTGTTPGFGGVCTVGKALDGAHSVAGSADAKSVYVAAVDVEANAVAVFARETAP